VFLQFLIITPAVVCSHRQNDFPLEHWLSPKNHISASGTNHSHRATGVNSKANILSVVARAAKGEGRLPVARTYGLIEVVQSRVVEFRAEGRT
jgi:hypothetical protein